MGKGIKKTATIGPDIVPLTQGLLVSGALNVILLVIVVGMLSEKHPPLLLLLFENRAVCRCEGRSAPLLLPF